MTEPLELPEPPAAAPGPRPRSGAPWPALAVAIDQVITTEGAAARTERNRLRMELVRPESTWLVNSVERL